MLKVFIISKVADWQPVGEYLLATAFGSPLSEPDNYSVSRKEAFRRTERLIQKGRIKEAVQYSAVALYQIKSDIVVSLVLTLEPSEKVSTPNAIHLSMVRVIPSVDNPHLIKVDDPLAQEIAHNILHVHEERKEGALTEVRHFFRTVS